MKKTTKKIEMKVADYVAKHNNSITDESKKITRHDVYDMIKKGELKAHKGYRGAWILELEDTTKTKTYTVKEYVETYNKKFARVPVTVPEVRKLLSDGKLEGKKVSGKWIVTSSPSKRIK